MKAPFEKLILESGVEKPINQECQDYVELVACLVVLKCAEIADEKHTAPGCGYITKTKGEKIREHFEVE